MSQLEVSDAPVRGDAFGLAVQDCWKAGTPQGKVREVVERDDALIGVEDVAVWFSGPDEWPDADRTLLDSATGRVLDVGCGPGRHATYLSDAGLAVVGLEPSPGAAAVARERGLTVANGSAYELPPSLGTFDTILLMGNNVGLLASAQTAPSFLLGLAKHANPGARILGECVDPYQFTDDLELAYQERNRSRGRLPGQTRIRIRYQRLISRFYEYLNLSADELDRLLTGSPWHLDSVVPSGMGTYSVSMSLR